jgi:pilus assembly protein CpaD
MARSKSIAALLLLGTALSACATTGKEGAVAANRSLDSYNQPVVEQTQYVFDVAVDDRGLPDGEAARLDDWFGSLGIGYADTVYVEEAYGPTRARDHIARIAAEHGLLLSEGAPITAGSSGGGRARVIIARNAAHVPNCPNWDQSGASSSTSSNYGCAVNSNLAAMVADPGDLVLGQTGSGTGDATTAAKAIKVYRDAEPTGTKGLITDRSRRQQ